jgi:hypothetical protein
MGAIYRLGATGKQFAAKPDFMLKQSPDEKTQADKRERMAFRNFPAVRPCAATRMGLRWSDGEQPLQYKENPVQAPANEAGPQK